MTQASNAGPGGAKPGKPGEFTVVDDSEANPLEQQAKTLDPLSALNKLADGEDPLPAEAPPAKAPAGAAPLAGGPDPAALPPRAAPTSAPPLTATARRQSFSPAAMVHGKKYKRVMVPLLLVVAGLLVLVGAASGFMLVNEKNTDQDSMLLTAVMCVSFPLAAGLCLGAWVFHRDLKRQ